MSIEEEIKQLEDEAADPRTREDTRKYLLTQAYFLKHGYRITPKPANDSRILNVIHLASGACVYEFSVGHFRYARMISPEFLLIDVKMSVRNKTVEEAFRFRDSMNTLLSLAGHSQEELSKVNQALLDLADGE